MDSASHPNTNCMLKNSNRMLSALETCEEDKNNNIIKVRMCKTALVNTK